mgnify:CR=1 FL=1
MKRWSVGSVQRFVCAAWRLWRLAFSARGLFGVVTTYATSLSQQLHSPTVTHPQSLTHSHSLTVTHSPTVTHSRSLTHSHLTPHSPQSKASTVWIRSMLQLIDHLPYLIAAATQGTLTTTSWLWIFGGPSHITHRRHVHSRRWYMYGKWSLGHEVYRTIRSCMHLHATLLSTMPNKGHIHRSTATLEWN